MIIGGIQRFSLVDYPGIPSAVIFTSGCNMRCGYCHNPELVLPELFADQLDLKEIYEFLDSRRNKLQGVVITGGEPTIRKDLPDVARTIKEKGFLLKLDSNGTNPKMLSKMISDNLIDYIAMDLKGPIERYSEIANKPINMDDIKESIKLIISSGIFHEFRSTVVKGQLTPVDFEKMGELIQGAQNYYLQKFIPTKTLDISFSKRKPNTDQDMLDAKEIMDRYVQNCEIR